jgi:peptidoglycan/xylan/chitin deacetylase (PgdA/CDA1 family)
MFSTRFTPGRHRIEPMAIERPLAAITLDVEPDYNTDARMALDRYPEAIAALAAMKIPLSVFVEGRILEHSPQIARDFAAAGAEVHLHCYDHRQHNDTDETLSRGARAFREVFGRSPEGYRAHTFRLTEKIFARLVEEGFKWDSSVLPGMGLGSTRGWPSDRGAALIDGRIVEFPLAAWGAVGLPISQSYRNLVGPLGERLLRRFCGMPRLLVYDMHMVDLVRALPSLTGSPIPRVVKAAMALSWRGRRSDSFASLTEFMAFLRASGYEFATLSGLYRTMSAETALPA